MAGVALAACSSGPGSSTTTTSSGASVPTASPLGSTTTTAAATTTTGTATCQVAQLHVVPMAGTGAAGTIEMSVDLTNQSASTCTLYGYPGMQLLDAGGMRLPTNVVRGGGPQFPNPAANQPPTTVVLSSGRTAAFGLSFSDVPVGGETTCPGSASALITPPGDFTSATVPLAIAPCGGGTIHVSPVYPTT
jgi:hypothetical protein